MRVSVFFFFNDTATTEIYTLSLHDALPIFGRLAHLDRAVGVADADPARVVEAPLPAEGGPVPGAPRRRDRKSTRLNSSHANISYAVFCLKKKNNTTTPYNRTTASATLGNTS